MDSWHLNNVKVITLNYVDWVPFSCIVSFHNWSQSSELILKNLFLEFLKNMSKLPLIWLYLTLKKNFELRCVNVYVLLLNMLHKNL